MFSIGPKNTKLQEDNDFFASHQVSANSNQHVQSRSQKCDKLTTDDGQCVL